MYFVVCYFLDTLRELFFQDLLPPDRKLVPFANRGAQLKTGTKRQLITWAFEDKLKVLYMSFVDAVKRMTADPVEKLRGKGIVTIYQLLVGLPEQEEVRYFYLFLFYLNSSLYLTFGFHQPFGVTNYLTLVLT